MAFNGGAHLLLPGLQIPQVLKALGQLPQELVVHGAVELLSVAGDKGDGVSLVNEMDYIFHLVCRPLQLLSQPLYHCIHLDTLLC